MSRPTPRQVRMLAAVVAAGSYKAAAYDLRRSESTIRNTMHDMKEQVGVDSLAQLVWTLRDDLQPHLDGGTNS